MSIENIRGEWAGGSFEAFMKDSYTYGPSPTLGDILGHADHGDIIVNFNENDVILRLSDGEKIDEIDMILQSDRTDIEGICKEIVERLSERHIRNMSVMQETLSRVNGKGPWRTTFETFHSGAAFEIIHGENTVVYGSLDSEGRDVDVTILAGVTQQAAAIMIRLDRMMLTVELEMKRDREAEKAAQVNEHAARIASEIEADIDMGFK